MAGECRGDSCSKRYYVDRGEELSGDFRATLQGAKGFWEAEFGREKAQSMAEHAMGIFEELVPGFPDVGGERNWCSQIIPEAAWYVALYAPMRARGKTAEDVGKLVYDLNRIRFSRVPGEKAREEGEEMFAPEAIADMRAWAEWTRKRKYPFNWVAEVIAGDGEAFDWGYDYTRCGAVEYLRAQGVPELAPYICLQDFVKSAALGTGLRRSKTIAQGDELCDFRYKKGRPVTQSWETEIELIRSRF